MGAEFTVSTTHTAAGISIRFPRIARVRDDKTWKTHTNLKELIKLSKAKPDQATINKLTQAAGKKGKAAASSSSSSSSSSKSKQAKAADSHSDDDSRSKSPKPANAASRKTFFDDSDDEELLSSLSSKAPVSTSRDKRKREDTIEDKDDGRKRRRADSDEDAPPRNLQKPKIFSSTPSNITYIPKSVTTPVDTGAKGHVVSLSSFCLANRMHLLILMLQVVMNIVDDTGKWPQDSVSEEIAKKWPEAKSKLKEAYARKEDSRLGDVQISKHSAGNLKVHLCMLVSRDSNTGDIDPGALKSGLKTVALLAKMKSATIHVSNITLASTNTEWDKMEAILAKLFGDRKIFIYTGLVPVVSKDSSSGSKATKKSEATKPPARASNRRSSDVDPDATQEMEEDELPPQARKDGKTKAPDSDDEDFSSKRPASPLHPGKRAALARADEEPKGNEKQKSPLRGLTIFFHGDLSSVQKLENMKRHVFMNGGDVVEEFESTVTHIVADSWDNVSTTSSSKKPLNHPHIIGRSSTSLQEGTPTWPS